MFQLDQFIAKYVTKRANSMFEQDLLRNKEKLGLAIKDKEVLVIGGAGTIGSSFIRALLPFEPKSLIVVDINENGLAELTRDLRSEPGLFVPDDFVTYPMSYADPVFTKMFIERGGFDIVANFSAHKHVRSEKDRYSVEALLENNVIRARKLLDLMVNYPPKHFFCVSTDKAANPVNIMGGSKKIMEEMIMSYSQLYPITTARFANVAFSNGSLPAAFMERLNKIQPLSAPSDIKRYFVSPEESGQICLLACILGKSGQVYFPKLQKEQEMSFGEIGINLLREFGYQPLICSTEQEALAAVADLKNGSKNYPIILSSSDTSGEKPYEEFYTPTEEVDLNIYEALGVVTNLRPKSMTEIDRLFVKLQSIFESSEATKADIVIAMKEFLVNFDHIEKGKSLDSKM
ncbi:MAG: polysaccharide biosynthesis protein [Bacteroidales bacterium]